MLKVYTKISVLFFICSFVVAEKGSTTFFQEEKENMFQLPNKAVQKINRAVSYKGSHEGDISNQIRLLREDVLKARESGSLSILIAAYDAFQKVILDETQWQHAAETYHIKKWSLQKTWRNVVGGNLFLLRSNGSASLVNAWSYAFSASFDNPVGLLYLAQNLSDMHLFHSDEGVSEFFDSLISKASSSLSKHLGDKDVFYAVASSYLCHAISYIKFEKLKKMHNPENLENHFLMLQIQKQLRAEENPSVDDYLLIARRGYHPAYLTAIDLLEIPQEKVQICEEAVRKGYYLALIKFADIYKKSDLKQYEYYLEKASDQDIPEAFIRLGCHLIGDIFNLKSDPFTSGPTPKEIFFSHSEEKYKKAYNLFKKAADLGSIDGLMHVGYLRELLSTQASSVEQEVSFRKEALNAYVMGCQIGYPESYRLLYSLDKKYYHYICDYMSPDPRYHIWEYFKDFLEGDKERSLQGFRNYHLVSKNMS